jgi:hypothetical protein
MVFDELQKLAPTARLAFTKQLPAPTYAASDPILDRALAASEVSLGIFQKMSRAVSGPHPEELTADLWRAALAVCNVFFFGLVTELSRSFEPEITEKRQFGIQSW